MAVDARQYLQELAQTTNLDAATLGSVMKALDNPKFAEALGQGVARQSDYSRAMDELRAQQSQVETIGRQQKEWWDKTKPAVDQTVAKLSDYERRFGPLDGDGGNRGGEGSGLSRAEVEKLLKEHADKGMAFTASVSKQMGYLLQDYAIKFPGKVLDLEAIEKKALEGNMTIRQAYESAIAPELEAKSKADHETELKKAREDGAREALSKHNIPVDSAPAEQAPFFRQPADGEKPLTDGDRARNFAATWQESAGKGAAL